MLHGKASGIDNTVVAYGGIISYKQGKISKLELPDKTIKIVLINSNTPKNTKNMVERVRKYRDEFTNVFDKIFESVNFISEQVGEYLTEGNIEKIKELMEINHNLLRTLGVSSRVLDDIVQNGLEYNIKGKMTGGGGGGMCVFIVTDEDLSDFNEFCKARGYTMLVTEITSQGLTFIDA